MAKNLVILKAIKCFDCKPDCNCTYRSSFFTTYTEGEDPTKLADGTVAYEIIDFADTVSEAQIKLYGRTY